MPKVILQGHIIVPTNELDTIQKALATHIELTRLEQGNLAFEVTQDKKHPNKFFVYEEFIDKNAFEFHQIRSKQSNWGKASVNIERHYEIK